MHILFELFVILYADGTVLMSETKEGMQQSLNIFQLYCDLWKLDVNINKTKVMVFSKKKNLNYSFILQDKQLEVVVKFSYLGIILKYNGTFFDTKKKNNFKWINYVESILNRAGLGYIFIRLDIVIKHILTKF